jgi:hypothetical protein
MHFIFIGHSDNGSLSHRTILPLCASGGAIKGAVILPLSNMLQSPQSKFSTIYARNAGPPRSGTVSCPITLNTVKIILFSSSFYGPGLIDQGATQHKYQPKCIFSWSNWKTWLEEVLA